MHVKIRYEKLKDQELIYKLISEAFDTSDEEKLVRLLHTDHQSLISLVAETDDSSIIGQAIISKMTAEKDETLKIYALAPMSVAPKYQHQGIGSKLIEAIIKEAKKNNINAIFVLGHPSYYPKFGFKPATEYQIKCEYDVPADVFMILDLSAKLASLKGQTVYYAEEFGKIF
ncbi:GNAT family N-acetyltransferase [Francisella tularensis]|uniref:GNAT family N-acetyltransferase n=1 Tax=Francisella tularensis TaxID=263 RepID=UPI000173E336|nr:N-acetyltransferase [Francisella tularensis]ACD31290.1 acetyltransferase [Francisella tularensis subsp. mediasiatica FSC147]MBK2078865.1 N-acetyltransferase [Francisella tularensis subsp. mediasiatica]MBK2102129.1 N-acetyltransferase [Francisella tularensis subsp. mediasiatica]MBK2105292.1 N-acetyltransferase [Francisella tularensis subsp. mediasiatica]MDN9003687.1 N-acetyltransferase [Francisella tularensis subsp. mediasiatica]